jgi:hypothetical protein
MEALSLSGIKAALIPIVGGIDEFIIEVNDILPLASRNRKLPCLKVRRCASDV